MGAIAKLFKFSSNSGHTTVGRILEQHKAGVSARKIGELFRMNNKTVSNIIDEVCKNPDSGKLHTQSIPASLPLANTLDRPLTAA